jgi:prepilin-type N-terminal cleavage/methylation domain-containing protein
MRAIRNQAGYSLVELLLVLLIGGLFLLMAYRFVTRIFALDLRFREIVALRIEEMQVNRLITNTMIERIELINARECVLHYHQLHRDTLRIDARNRHLWRNRQALYLPHLQPRNFFLSEAQPLQLDLQTAKRTFSWYFFR